MMLACSPKAPWLRPGEHLLQVQALAGVHHVEDPIGPDLAGGGKPRIWNASSTATAASPLNPPRPPAVGSRHRPIRFVRVSRITRDGGKLPTWDAS